MAQIYSKELKSEPMCPHNDTRKIRLVTVESHSRADLHKLRREYAERQSKQPHLEIELDTAEAMQETLFNNNINNMLEKNSVHHPALVYIEDNRYEYKDPSNITRQMLREIEYCLNPQGGKSKFYETLRLLGFIKTDAVTSTIDLALQIRTVIQQWLEVIYDAVCEAMTSVKNTMIRWAIALKNAVELLFAATGKKIAALIEFFGMLANVKIVSADDKLIPNLEHILKAEELAYKSKKDTEALTTIEMLPQQGDPWYERWPAACSACITGLVVMVTSIAESIAGFATTSNVSVAKMMTSCFSAYSAIARVDFASHMKFAFNCIYHWITGKNYFMQYELVENYDKVYHKLCANVSVISAHRNPTATQTRQCANLLAKLEDIYPALLAAVPDKAAQYRTMHENIVSKAKPWAISSRSARRLKPITVAFSGPAATGKTFACNQLCDLVMKQVQAYFDPRDPEKDFATYVDHAKESTKFTLSCLGEKDKFDEGYMDPLFYCMEELYTSKDATDKSAWAQHFMKVIDDQPLLLNMAFDEKGKRYFNSPFVFATGNFNTHHIPFEDVTAYHRRMELDLRVTKIVPIGEKFDMFRHTRFRCSPENQLTISDPNLCPSPVLTMMREEGFDFSRSFGFSTLLSIVAAMYIERITYDALREDSFPADIVRKPENLYEPEKRCMHEFRNASNTFLDKYKHIPMKDFKPLGPKKPSKTDPPPPEDKDAPIPPDRQTILTEGYSATMRILADILQKREVFPTEEPALNYEYNRAFFIYLVRWMHTHQEELEVETKVRELKQLLQLPYINFDIVVRIIRMSKKKETRSVVKQMTEYYDAVFTKIKRPSELDVLNLLLHTKYTVWSEETENRFQNFFSKCYLKTMEHCEPLTTAYNDLSEYWKNEYRKLYATKIMIKYGTEDEFIKIVREYMKEKSDYAKVAFEQFVAIDVDVEINGRTSNEAHCFFVATALELYHIIEDRKKEERCKIESTEDVDSETDELIVTMHMPSHTPRSDTGKDKHVNQGNSSAESLSPSQFEDAEPQCGKEWFSALVKALTIYQKKPLEPMNWNISTLRAELLRVVPTNTDYLASLEGVYPNFSSSPNAYEMYQKVAALERRYRQTFQVVISRVAELLKVMPDLVTLDNLFQKATNHECKVLTWMFDQMFLTKCYFMIRADDFHNRCQIEQFRNKKGFAYDEFHKAIPDLTNLSKKYACMTITRSSHVYCHINVRGILTFQNTFPKQSQEAYSRRKLKNKRRANCLQSANKQRQLDREAQKQNRTKDYSKMNDRHKQKQAGQRKHAAQKYDMEPQSGSRFAQLKAGIRSKFSSDSFQTAAANSVKKLVPKIRPSWKRLIGNVDKITEDITESTGAGIETLAFTLALFNFMEMSEKHLFIIAAAYIEEARVEQDPIQITALNNWLLDKMYLPHVVGVELLPYAILGWVCSSNMPFQEYYDIFTACINETKIQTPFSVEHVSAFILSLSGLLVLDADSMNNMLVVAGLEEENMSVGQMLLITITLIIVFSLTAGLVAALVSLFRKKEIEEHPEIPTSKEDVDRLMEYYNRIGYDVKFEKHSAPENAHPDAHHKNIAASIAAKHKLTPQSAVDEALMEKVMRNMFVIMSMGGVEIGSMLFVGGNIALMNRHVYHGVSDHLKIFPYRDASNPNILLVNKRDCTIVSEIIERDLIWVEIPTVRQFARLEGYFLDQKELFRQSSCDQTCILYFDDNHDAMRGSIDLLGTVYNECDNVTFGKESNQIHIKERCLYHWKTAKSGKCGSIVMGIVNKRLYILAVHGFGSSSKGVGGGTMVSKEMVVHACPNPMAPEALNNKARLSSLIGFEDEDVTSGFYTFEPQIGKFISPCKTMATDTTTFVPTEFYDFKNGPPKIPAILTRQAYNLAIEKEQKNVRRVLEKNYYELAGMTAQIVLNKLFPVDHTRLFGCRTLTVDEALYGYKDLPNFDKTTSEGMRLKKWKINKQKLLDGDPDTYRRFREHFDPLYENIITGIFLFQLSADKLKDEPRDLERVELMKTRIFNVTDFIDNLLLKMFCGDLIQKTKDLFMIGSQSCGINPYSEVWSEITRMFYNMKVVVTDISGNDHCANASVKPTWDEMSKFYTTQRDRVLFLYGCLACLHGLRFNGGIARYNGTGNTSGNYITTFFNTGNTATWFIGGATRLLVKDLEDDKKNQIALKIVNSDHRGKYYSDDNISAMPRVAAYTGLAMCDKFMELYGIELTSTSKGRVGEDMTIWEADFLSRGFRKEDELVFCPLSYESLISQLYFVRVERVRSCTRAEILKQLQINLDNVSREIMEWPRTEAILLCGEILDYIRARNLPLSFTPAFNLSPLEYKVGVS